MSGNKQVFENPAKTPEFGGVWIKPVQSVLVPDSEAELATCWATCRAIKQRSNFSNRHPHYSAMPLSLQLESQDRRMKVA